MEELAKLLAKTSAEVETLTKRNTELEQELASAVKRHADERRAKVQSSFEDLQAMKGTERKRSKFLGEIVNRPLKRAREIAAEEEFEIRVLYEDGKYCKQRGGTEALNSREVWVAVVKDVITGHDALNRHDEKVWAPAAVFPYAI